MPPLSMRQESLRRAEVLEVAIDLTGSLGLDQVTIRAIADRLEVWPTTVKHHLGDIDDIKDVVADEIAGRIPIPPRGRSRWQTWVKQFGLGARLHLRGYAGVARRIQQRGATSQQQIKAIDTVTTVLLVAGFRPRDAALAYGLVVNWVVDFAEVEAYRRHDPATGETIAQRMAVLARNQAALLPGFGAVAPEWVSSSADDWFDFGLDVLLAGLERRCIR